jgi:bacterioferritin (cytochrome b1)
MNLPLIDAAEYFLNLKQAAEEILPVVGEHADDGELLHALSEAAKSKLGLAIAYRVYSESLRDPSNSAIGEHFKEHSEDCLNDVDFFVRRSSVMSGGASLEGVESPPASGDLTEILQVLSKMEEANLQLMSELVVLLEGNPSKYEVEAMMAKDQHHLDDLTQHMPVAPELPSVAEELPSVEEAASPAAPLGVIGPAKMAGVSAKRGLSRVGELLSGSRVKKLEGLSEKLRDGKPLGDHAVVVNVRRLTRAQKGVEAERNSVRTARAITAIGATGVGAAGAHKLRSKKDDGKEKTSELGAAAMGQHSPVPPPAPLNGAAAGQHAKIAVSGKWVKDRMYSGIKGLTNDDKGRDALQDVTMRLVSKGQKAKNGRVRDLYGDAVIATGSAPRPWSKTAQRTYDMGGSKRDGKAYSMHTTPDDYELSQLISSKMDRDLRGVRGKAKNEGMLVGSGLGAVKGLKAGKGWGGGQVIRTGGGGGTVIGTFGSGGKMPKGMGADIRENQGMIRDELRGQGIKIGADKSDSELAETGRQRAIANLASGFTSDKHTSGERHGTLAGRLGGAAVGAGAGALASRGATLPVRLAAGMGGAVIGGSMGGQIGKTIGSDHDAEKFWANHKEAAEGVAESFGRAAGRVVKHTGLHDAVVSGGAGPLVNAIKKPFVDIKDGIVSGYNKGADETKGWNHKEAGVKTADLHFGKGDHVHSVGMFVGHEPEDGNHEASARKLSELLRQHGSVNKARSAYLADHPNHFVTVAAYRSDKPRSGGPSVHISSGRAGGVEQSNLYSDVFGMGWKERHTKEAGAMSSAAKWLAAHPAAVGGVAGSAIGAAGGAVAGGPEHRLSGALGGAAVGGAVGATAGHVGGRLLRAAPSPAPAQLASGKPGTIMAGPLPDSHVVQDGLKGKSLTVMGGEELASQYDKLPQSLRSSVEDSDLVRGIGTPNGIKIQPHNAAALLGMHGHFDTASMRRNARLAQEAASGAVTKVSSVFRPSNMSEVGRTASHGDKEMSPVLGKRVMRSAKQVWDKAVKQAMGEEVPVEQYLQEEAAGRQAQEAVESDYLRQQLQQTTQQLEQVQAQAQEQEAQVGEMQGTIQQLQGQQAEQAQAADAAVQTARQTAEAAMSQSMRRSAELMKQTQLAAGLQNAAATMKEQLMALSQTPVPPATVGEAGELDAAAQQQVGQDQAMEEQAAMEQEAQMAAAQGAPPAAAPALPKTAGMISGAGKILRNAPGGVVGGVVGAASAAGLGALLRHKETAFLQDAVKKLEAKQQGGFLTGMMLAEARMVADRSAVMDQHPGKAALMNAVRGAGAGFALDKTIRHIS